MSTTSIPRSLAKLDDLKRYSGVGHETRLLNSLRQVARQRFRSATDLIHLHETLLFLRAYPYSRRVLPLVESILNTFTNRLEKYIAAGGEEGPFVEADASGIAGTSLTARFSYVIARWLATRHPTEVEIDWDGYKDEARMGATLPRFIPLLEEEALVEASVPYKEWLRSARGRRRELPWLIRQFDRSALPEKNKAELYDSLQIYIHWTPRRFASTRTGMRLKTRSIFFHKTAQLTRRDVSLERELNGPGLTITKLSRRDGEALLNAIRDTSTMRYRELHGFTFADASHFVRADAGRGVEIFMNGVAPENRLPLRAYHSAFMVKNGVPIGYVEGLSIFERMEVGFNIYYTFRDGESAWLYARTLRLFKQLLGVTAFSVDPYQIGHENEEGIDSGAFWFYRKMGFRPVRPEIVRLVNREESKVKADPKHRTAASTLRRLARTHMLFTSLATTRSDLDRFQIHNVGIRVARMMAERHDGDSRKMHGACERALSRTLDIDLSLLGEEERRTFANFATVLALVPGIGRWSADEKDELTRILRAKSGVHESRYLLLMQKHRRLREAIISLGS